MKENFLVVLFLDQTYIFKKMGDNHMLRTFKFKIVSNPFIQTLWLSLNHVTHILGIPLVKGDFVHAT